MNLKFFAKNIKYFIKNLQININSNINIEKSITNSLFYFTKVLDLKHVYLVVSPCHNPPR